MIMTKEDCINIGYISKAHGVRGDLRAVFDVHDLREYVKRKSFWFAKKDGPLVEGKLTFFRPQQKMEVLIHLEGVEDRNAAENWVGSTLYIPAEELPKLKDGHFYYFQVIGFTVMDEQLGALGTVRDFADGSAQDIMVMDYQDKEVLIPMTDTFVGKADFEKKLIYTNLPEGLVEAYLE